MYLDVKSTFMRMLETDEWLKPYQADIEMRFERYNDTLRRIAGDSPIADFADGYMFFGFHRTQNGWVFREWLPAADNVWLVGDFNGWDYGSHPLTKRDDGVWEIELEGRDALKHGQYVKLFVEHCGNRFERIPAYIRWTDMDWSMHRLCGRIWMPDEEFSWTDAGFRASRKQEPPFIYEAHVGMAQEYEGIGSYREFEENVLPRIKKLGYNAVQLMAIQEHPYYASFGYQVTNFFAPSFRYGSPDELRHLIDTAHAMGIRVLLDVVHSHACPNDCEGLNYQDGTEDQYFLYGGRGWHPAWQTRLFNYGKTEVLHFLLSNLKYWLEEFHFDGFRFDGVTSMCYEDHGLGSAFMNYSMYFGLNTNVDALIYLTMANEVIHAVDPAAITVAEEMSGMPGMCLPVEDGGIGFDYRLSMGLPDMWIKLIKEVDMRFWDVGKIYFENTNVRKYEKSIAYAESHDQALVGDKTIIFRLADAEMYTGMERSYHSLSMDTAIDMHKLIRFVTLSLANGGYLNFMGNEFGHPEWIDFPRAGNNWSYYYARRQWSLSENGLLKYSWLNEFDAGMIGLARTFRLLEDDPRTIWMDFGRKAFSFCRAGLIFVFNFHPTNSIDNYFIHTHLTGDGTYRAIFTTDDPAYGGAGRMDPEYEYKTEVTAKGDHGFLFYIPCRSAAVLKRVDEDPSLPENPARA